MKDSRSDFVSLLVDRVRAGDISKEEMTAHVSTLTYVVSTPSPRSISPKSLRRRTYHSGRRAYLTLETSETNCSSLCSIAGGETVATTLTGITYFLSQNPHVFERLATEIRGSFKAYQDINATVAQQLPYLQALINEGLRLFPPASGGAPRVSPGFELHGHYIPQGVGTLVFLIILQACSPS